MIAGGRPWTTTPQSAYARPLVSLDAITSRIRQDAGADFAFILTRKGRLLTREAPPQMPEVGRAACVAAALEASAAGLHLVERTMPREHLVPFGGAAPVDVFVAPCGEAIVCIVLATWADTGAVGPALDASIPELEALLASAKAQRAGGRVRTGRTVAPPAPPPPPDALPAPKSRPVSGVSLTGTAAQTRPARPPRERASSRPARPAAPATAAPRASRPPPSSSGAATSRPPSSRGATRSPSSKGSVRPPSTRPRPLAGLVELSKSGIRAHERMQDAPTIAVRPGSLGPAGAPARAALTSDVPLGGRGSLPQIDVGEARLGRETIAAIQADGHARGSIPHIEVREAMLGRDTLAAIDEDHDAMLALTNAPSIEVGSVELREIELGEAELGLDSLVAIEADARDGTPAGSPLTSAPDVHVDAIPAVDLGSVPPPGELERTTQPWTEAPEDTVRATRAAKLGRKLAPPVVEARPLDPAELRRRKQNSGVDLFHEALGELLGDPGPGDPAPADPKRR